VLKEEGVLVDYIGDELMAMWGAPGDQPDHAARACRAALAILDRIPELNKRWHSTLGGDMQLGIGINTGIAYVGNVGSRHKFKYGALGNTVNLGSRVQGATKYFKACILVTEETARHLDDSFMTRRLGRVRVVGIETPVQLYELFSPDWAFGCQAKENYERALELFEKKEFNAAARTLGNWRFQCSSDEPVLVLMYRAVRAQVEGPHRDHPVMVLTDK
jgi:adenylate cyclase